MKIIGDIINGQAAAAWDKVNKYIAKLTCRRIVIEVRPYNEGKEISSQQIRWWKGVLLPYLSDKNGDSIAEWEVRLKTSIMPDEFQPIAMIINGMALNIVPSVTSLSVKQTNVLIEGTVDWCRSHGFEEVTLPDSTLRVY